MNTLGTDNFSNRSERQFNSCLSQAGTQEQNYSVKKLKRSAAAECAEIQIKSKIKLPGSSQNVFSAPLNNKNPSLIAVQRSASEMRKLLSYNVNGGWVVFANMEYAFPDLPENQWKKKYLDKLLENVDLYNAFNYRMQTVRDNHEEFPTLYFRYPDASFIESSGRLRFYHPGGSLMARENDFGCRKDFYCEVNGSGRSSAIKKTFRNGGGYFSIDPWPSDNDRLLHAEIEPNANEPVHCSGGSVRKNAAKLSNNDIAKIVVAMFERGDPLVKYSRV